MNVYWLEQTEADVPAENDWLSENEAVCLTRYALCQAPCRLAARTLDGETRAVGLPGLAGSSPSL